MRLIDKPIYSDEFKHFPHFFEFERLLRSEAKRHRLKGKMDKVIEN